MLDELTAISQGIAVLHADDSRDIFARSFASQGYTFLQEAQYNRSSDGSLAVEIDDNLALVQSAAEVLRKTARAAGDNRLVELAKKLITRVDSGGTSSSTPAPDLADTIIANCNVTVSNSTCL